MLNLKSVIIAVERRQPRSQWTSRMDKIWKEQFSVSGTHMTNERTYQRPMDSNVTEGWKTKLHEIWKKYGTENQFNAHNLEFLLSTISFLNCLLRKLKNILVVNCQDEDNIYKCRNEILE